jgi:hypothetical protein
MDKTRCKKRVWLQGGFVDYQCSRKIWKDGYCKQHHPETVEERQGKSDMKWEEKIKIREKGKLFTDYQTVIMFLQQHGFNEVAEYFQKKLGEL